MCLSPTARLLYRIPIRIPPSASWPCPGRLRSISSSRPEKGSSRRMRTDLPSRRTILKSLAVGAAVGSVLRVIPLQAAEYAHHLIDDEKSATQTAYAPKFFDPHQYKTLQLLCETIIPADADSGGAIEAGAPEFIDLLTSENTDYQKTLGDGLKWLDSTCTTRYGKAWLDSTPQQQAEILDLIAYRKNAKQD